MRYLFGWFLVYSTEIQTCTFLCALPFIPTRPMQYSEHRLHVIVSNCVGLSLCPLKLLHFSKKQDYRIPLHYIALHGTLINNKPL